MSPKTAISASTPAATAVEAATSSIAITTPTITSNKRTITKEMVKTANLLTAKSTSTTNSSSPSTTFSSSRSSATKLAAASSSTFKPPSLALTSSGTKKLDPYSMLSFASAASTSVSLARSMSCSNTNAIAMKIKEMKAGIMSYQNVIAMLILLFLFSGMTGIDGLKCHMCGQYNEGVGSITPCLNYSDQYAHLYLKECPKASEKYCVKYVSELSTVRDCATECAEKEVWETKTYCCNTDGCNAAGSMEASLTMLLMPVLYFIYRALKLMFKTQH